MSDTTAVRLDESRAHIEEALRQYQGWGLAMLRERVVELEQAIAESAAACRGGGLPTAATATGGSDLWYASPNN
jgi:hypothetical protein